MLLLDPGPSLGRCRGHGWQVRQGQATSSSLPMRSPCSSVAPLASASAPGHLENWGEASGSQGAWPERHRSGWTSMTCGVSTGRAQGQITNLFPEEMTAATGCSHVRPCFQHGACGGAPSHQERAPGQRPKRIPRALGPARGPTTCRTGQRGDCSSRLCAARKRAARGAANTRFGSCLLFERFSCKRSQIPPVSVSAKTLECSSTQTFPLPTRAKGTKVPRPPRVQVGGSACRRPGHTEVLCSDTPTEPSVS